MISELSADELKLVQLEPAEKSKYIRVWYPKSKFTQQSLSQEGFRIQIQKAIEKQDWELVKQLKERMKTS